MPTIFGKDASAEDFQLLMQSLYALSMPGARGGDFAHMIKPVEEAQTISEETFIELADRVGGSIIEETPGRLTLAEIRQIKGRVTNFEGLADILDRYGYQEAALFRKMAEVEGGRVDALYDAAAKDSFDPGELPSALQEDKHFILALISLREFLYRRLPPIQRSDEFFVLDFLRTKIIDGGSFNERYLFEDVPDALRMSPRFLTSLKDEIVAEFGSNIILPENFRFLKEPGVEVPECLKDFRFWYEFYGGDKEKAFEVGVMLDIIPKDVILVMYLSGPEASRYYSHLPERLKADGDIAAKALQSDPRSAKYLPGGAPLLELPSTWMAILGDEETRYWDPPAFPATLIADAKLINEIVSRKPRILASYVDDAEALRRIIPQLSPENLARFVAEFPAAYELLPDGTKTEAFALKVVQADPRGRLTAPLVRRYGAKLAIAAFDADPMSLLEIPDEVAESKEVKEYVLQRIRDLKAAECPYWAVAYFEKHPGTALEFIRTKPEWLEGYSFVTIPGVYEALARQFAEVITTPKQMEMFLAAAYAGARDDVPSPIGFITSYDGEITGGIRHQVNNIIFRTFKDAGRACDKGTARMLITKYGVIPDGLGDRLDPLLREIKDPGTLLSILRQHSKLNLRQVGIIAKKLIGNHEALYAAAMMEPRLLGFLADADWTAFEPYLKRRLSESLDDVAELYSVLPERLRQDKDLALKATLIDSDNYYYIPDSLKSDECFMIELCGWGNVPAYDMHRLPLDAQAAAAARYPSQLHLIDPEVRQDPRFLEKALSRNIWLYLKLTPEEKRQAWPILVRLLSDAGLPAERARSWGDLVGMLRSKSAAPMRIRSISAWRRIHPEMFVKGAGGDPGEGGGKKVLVIASPKDWNGAFMTVPLIDRYDSLGAGRIDYREVGSEAELRALIAELKEGGIVYDEILIAGHGTSDTIALGGQDRRVGADEKLDDDLYIDFSDFSDASLDLSPLLATDGSLYLFSCSNGEGAKEKDNIANRYAGTLYKGQRVVSSQVPTNIMYMDFDEQGRTDPYWVGMRPYITAGRKEG